MDKYKLVRIVTNEEVIFQELDTSGVATNLFVLDKEKDVEILELFDNNPTFRTSFSNLILLRFQIEREFLVAARPLLAHEVEDGRFIEKVILGKPDQLLEEVLPRFWMLEEKVESLARRLSAYFPTKRRWHWQDRFISQGFGGTGVIRQRYRGGRKNRTAQPLKRRKNIEVWQMIIESG
jgi:hypothetical protein